MFGILGSLAKATVNVIVLPVAVTHDLITLGGTLTDRNQSMTEDCLENITESFEEIIDTK